MNNSCTFLLQRSINLKKNEKNMMILNCVLLIIAVVFASIAIYNTLQTKRDCKRLKKANELQENMMMEKLIELNESRKFYEGLLKEKEKKEE